jgi:transposase-like protein
MNERGIEVDHSTVFRWVQRYAPEINKRIRPHLKMSDTSYRVDETYIKIGKSCKYLYRAVDKQGNTIEFMLSAKRDVSAAKRFFKKMMRASIDVFRSQSVWIRMLLIQMLSLLLKMKRSSRMTASFAE